MTNFPASNNFSAVFHAQALPPMIQIVSFAIPIQSLLTSNPDEPEPKIFKKGYIGCIRTFL
jgi:hypothetical protein